MNGPFRTLVEFDSDLFPVDLTMEESVNPETGGTKLSQYLLQKLPEQGIPVVEFDYEDWGCYLPFQLGNFKGFIGCSNQGADHLLIQIWPNKPIVRKFPFKKIDISTELRTIAAALDKVLCAESGITDIRWSDD